MRKLRKKYVRFENSVESYASMCSCGCNCSFLSGVLEQHAGSVNAFRVNRDRR